MGESPKVCAKGISLGKVREVRSPRQLNTLEQMHQEETIKLLRRARRSKIKFRTYRLQAYQLLGCNWSALFSDLLYKFRHHKQSEIRRFHLRPITWY